jgi:hypothetical protein
VGVHDRISRVIAIRDTQDIKLRIIGSRYAQVNE